MFKSIFAIVLLVWGSASMAAATADKAVKLGQDYEAVSPPQPTSEPGKIEVMEFFGYECPHCFHFEPYISEWLKHKPANVVFVRQPVIFRPTWVAHAKLFYTAEVLGVTDKVHADVFDAIHNKKNPLQTEEELSKFFVAHGVKAEDFQNAYRSFAVDSKVRQAEGAAARYGVDGTPSIVVNGKYRVSAELAKSLDGMIAVTNALIKQESATK